MPRLLGPRPLLAVVAVVGLAFGACAGSEDVTREQFEADLLERTQDGEGEPQLTEEQAACLSDAVFEDYDQAEINRIYRAATEDELGNERRDELAAINERCLGEAGGDDEADAEG